jgi:hypothetical protein
MMDSPFLLRNRAMLIDRSNRTARGAWMCVAVFAIAGCGGPQTAPTEISLRKLASYYGMYISSHKGAAPANEKELRGFISAKDGDADLESLFRSARDGQPYVVIYHGTAKTMPSTVIAHEKEGQAGKRFVAFSTTEVRELDEATFKQAIEKR